MSEPVKPIKILRVGRTPSHDLVIEAEYHLPDGSAIVEPMFLPGWVGDEEVKAQLRHRWKTLATPPEQLVEVAEQVEVGLEDDDITVE